MAKQRKMSEERLASKVARARATRLVKYDLPKFEGVGTVVPVNIAEAASAMTQSLANLHRAAQSLGVEYAEKLVEAARLSLTDFVCSLFTAEDRAECEGHRERVAKAVRAACDLLDEAAQQDERRRAAESIVSEVLGE